MPWIALATLCPWSRSVLALWKTGRTTAGLSVRHCQPWRCGHWTIYTFLQCKVVTSLHVLQSYLQSEPKLVLEAAEASVG